MQCAGGCVLCTLCYSEQSGCRLHNMSSTRAAVSTTANTLANCPALENVGDWDLELNIDDMFKTDKEVNVHLQLIMNEEQSPGVDTLKRGMYITIYRYISLCLCYTTMTSPDNVAGLTVFSSHAAFNHLITVNDTMSFRYWVN